MENKAFKVVFVVTERAGKSYWSRIGIATTNRDGSWTLKLDAIPMTGTLQLRDPDARDDARPASDAGVNGRRARDAEVPLV